MASEDVQQVQSSSDSLTVEDVRAIVAEYNEANMSAYEGLHGDIVAVGEQVDTIVDSRLTSAEGAISADVSQQLKELSKALSEDEGTTSVVILDAKQADWIQTGVQVGMTGLVFVGLMIAAILGVLLWDNFSRGWRRG